MSHQNLIRQRHGRCPSFPSQRGMALIMALVILLILTILGVTAMTTSSLEEKMSGNIQEQNRAFHAAESGISKVVLDPNAYNPVAGFVYSPSPYTFDSGRSGTAQITAEFKGFSNINRGPVAYGGCCRIANFTIKSVGTTVTNAKSVHHQGIGQIARKN